MDIFYFQYHRCSQTVGSMLISAPNAVARRAKLLIGEPFTCDCVVKAWRFNRIKEATRKTYAAIWRQVNTTGFVLVGKTTLPMDMGDNTFIGPHPIRVQKGDIIGIHAVDAEGEGTTGIGYQRDCPTGVVISPLVLDDGWMDNFFIDVGSDSPNNQCISLSAICTI